MHKIYVCPRRRAPQPKFPATTCRAKNSTRHLQIHNLRRSKLESLLFFISSLSELNALFLLKRCKRSLSTRNFHQKCIEDKLSHKTTALSLQHLLNVTQHLLNVNVMQIRIIHQGKPVKSMLSQVR